MYEKYNITIIDNFKIYNEIDRTGLWHDVGSWFYNGRQTISWHKNHIIIYYRILNINIKIYEIILFGDKNQLIDLINKGDIYSHLSNYIDEIKHNYKVKISFRTISIIHSKIYYYITKFNSFINNIIDKIKIKRKFNKPIEFGYE